MSESRKYQTKILLHLCQIILNFSPSTVQGEGKSNKLNNNIELPPLALSLL